MADLTFEKLNNRHVCNLHFNNTETQQRLKPKAIPIENYKSKAQSKFLIVVLQKSIRILPGGTTLRINKYYFYN